MPGTVLIVRATTITDWALTLCVGHVPHSIPYTPRNNPVRLMFSPLLKITPPACTNSVPTTVLSTALSICSFIFPRTRGVGTHSPHFTAQEPCSERPTSPVRQQSWDVLVDVSSVSLSPGQPAATEPRFQPPTPTPRPGGQPVAPFRGGAPTPLGCQHPATLLNEWMQPPCPYASRCPHKPQSHQHFVGSQGTAASGWGFSFPVRWEGWRHAAAGIRGCSCG